MDLKIAQDLNGEFDLVFANNDLQTEDGLETSIILSLYTDRRVTADELDDGETDPRGWWGDTFFSEPNYSLGSKLWLLRRRKHTAEVRELIKEYVEEALQWMVEDGVVKSVSAMVAYVSLERSDVTITISRPSEIDFKFNFAWRSISASE